MFQETLGDLIIMKQKKRIERAVYIKINSLVTCYIDKKKNINNILLKENTFRNLKIIFNNFYFISIL